jgi:hypothetical protein
MVLLGVRKLVVASAPAAFIALADLPRAGISLAVTVAESELRKEAAASRTSLTGKETSRRLRHDQ